MNIEIIDKPLSFELVGFSGIAAGRDYVGTAFKLSDRMWKTVRSGNLKNEGKNIWVYEADEKVFAGIQLLGTPDKDIEMERKKIVIARYAYYKHIGPYQGIQQAGRNMRAEILSQGLQIGQPYIEIYGHWTKDESKLETELIMAVEG